ncbi:MAG: FtsX-like permease family protein [Candidatus Heimdallarchaeota archaeon]|nr:FtsX-like permease family protein [Candidatus Heimdallarchaeota archaeon]
MSEFDKTSKISHSWIIRVIILLLNLLILYILTDMILFIATGLGFLLMYLGIYGIILYRNKKELRERPELALEIERFMSNLAQISAISEDTVSRKQYIINIERAIQRIQAVVQSLKDQIGDQIEIDSISAMVRKFVMVDSKFTKFENKRTSILDAFAITRKYLRINRKYIIVSLAGLFLSALILSQSYVMVESYRQEHFNNYLEGKDNTAFDIKVSDVPTGLISQYSNFVESHKLSWSSTYNLDITSIDTFAELDFLIIQGKRYNLDQARVWVDTIPSHTHIWTERMYDLLKQFPTFPDIEFNESQNLLVITPYLTQGNPQVGYINYTTSDFLVNGSFQLLVEADYKIGNFNTSALPDFANYTVPNMTVDHIWKVSQTDIDYNNQHEGIIDGKILEGTYFLPQGSELNLINEVVNYIQTAGVIWVDNLELHMRSQIHIKRPTISDVNLANLEDQLGKSINIIREDILEFASRFNLYTALPRVLSKLRDRIAEYLINVSTLDFIIPVTMTPLVLISLFMLFFSLNLIEKWKQTIFSIMLQRGTNSNQMRLMLITEILALSFIAMILGMWMAIPITSLMLRSSGLLEFAGESIPILIPSFFYWKVPLLTVLISSNFYISNIVNVHKIDILKSYESTETTIPVWRRLNLDVIIFSYGLLFWIIVPNISLGTYAGPIYLIMGTLAILAVIFGFPLVLARYLTETIGFFLKGLTKRLELIKLSINNIRKRKYFTSMLTALIIISMLLSFVALVIPVTFAQVSSQRAMYEVGADIYVDDLDLTDLNMQSMFTIEDVAYASVYFMDYKPHPNDLSAGELPLNYRFLAINSSNFADVVYWDDDFSTTSLQEIIAIDDDSVAIQQDVREGLHLDDQITLKYRTQYLNYLSIHSTFKYFPRLVEQLPVATLDNVEVEVVPLVVSIKTLFDFAEVIDGLISAGTYIDVFNENDIKEVSKEISRIYASFPDIEVQNSIDLLESYEREGQNDFLLKIMHVILLVSMTIFILSILFYNFITIRDRSKEIAILRALGMIRKQVSLILFAEIISLILLGAIAGAVSGYTVSYGLLTILNQTNFFNYVVPIGLILNPERILIYTAIMIVTGISSAIYPILKLSKGQTGSILSAT